MITNKIFAIGLAVAFIWQTTFTLLDSGIVNIPILWWLILTIGVIGIFSIFKYLIPSFNKTLSKQKTILWRCTYAFFIAYTAIATANHIKILSIWPKEFISGITVWSYPILLLIHTLTLLIALFYPHAQEKQD